MLLSFPDLPSSLEPGESYLQMIPEVGWTCRSCGYNATRADVLKHVQARHLKIKFHCQYCDKVYTQASHRRKHFLRDHNLDLSIKRISELAKESGLQI